MVIFLILAIYKIAKIYKSISKNAAKLYEIGKLLINKGAKIFSKLDNVLYWSCAKQSTYRLLRSLGQIVGIITVFTSIGGIVQYVVDCLDGKWDGYLNTSNIKPKFVFRRS